MNRLPIQRALLAPTALRTTAVALRGARFISSAVPEVAQPAFWKSMVPKFLRPAENPRRAKKKSKGWNPATFFIAIFLLIGSMSIQMIALKKEFEAFTRRADVKIGLLREVVEKLQRGEEVDVEHELGTGDAEKEQAWENILKEFEFEDVARQQKKKQTPTSQPPVEEVKSAPSPETLLTQPKTVVEGEGEFF